jgi:peptidoglycan hydrolase CwlO-like protein
MSSTGVAAASADQKKKRNPWLWVSAALAIAVVGLLIWGLKSQSDLDSAQQDVKDLQAQVEQGQQTGGAVALSVKQVFNDLQNQLSSTTADLAASEQKVKDAQAAAAEAEQEVAAAKEQVSQATSQIDKATAEADQAKAEAKAASSKVQVAAGCAESYVGAFGALFDGQGADDVKQQLQTITADCKAALAGT